MSIERPQEAGSGNPEASFPDQMLSVEIPQGTILDEGEIQGGEVHRQFGISHMQHGMIQRYTGERTEGTVLWFNNNTFRVDIARRELSATDINRVNELIRSLEEIAVIFQFLPKQIKTAEELSKDLEVSKHIFRSSEVLKTFDPAKTVQELGILISKMKSSDTGLREKWGALVAELSSAGVTSIWDQHGGALGSVPVEKMAQKPPSV